MFFNRTLSESEVDELYVMGRANWQYKNKETIASSAKIPIEANSKLILPELMLKSENQFYTPILKSSSASPITVNITGVPSIEFVSPTPANGQWIGDSIEIGASINDSTLNEVIWNWDGTNNTIFDDSLMVMYNFDNVSVLGENDTYIVEMSGNGNDGVAYDNAAPTSYGKYNGAYEFDGNGDYLFSTYPNSDDLSHLTASAWINLAQTPCQAYEIINQRMYDSTLQNWRLRYYCSRLQFAFGNSTDKLWTSTDGGTLSNPNEWYYVAVTFDNGNVTLYINGELMTSQDYGPDNISRQGGIGDWLFIGKYGGSGYYMNGSIDEVRMWERTLSSEEVKQQYLSNLNKYGTENWRLYVKEKQARGFDNGDYNYQVFSYDEADGLGMSEQRTASSVCNPPAAAGNWEINGTEVCKDRDIYVDGHILVRDGDTLILDNVNLYLNLTANAQHGIYIYEGGNLSAYDSQFLEKESNNYYYLTIYGNASFNNCTAPYGSSASPAVTYNGTAYVSNNSNIYNFYVQYDNPKLFAKDSYFRNLRLYTLSGINLTIDGISDHSSSINHNITSSNSDYRVELSNIDLGTDGLILYNSVGTLTVRNSDFGYLLHT
jgi:hypothetical protein